MASYRLDKMASLVQAMVGEAIAHKLNDPRIAPLTSVTRVQISRDLQVAKVFVSVLGSEKETQRTLEGLEHAAGHLQRLVARQLQVRHCPTIRFICDPAVKGALRTVQIIEESVKADRARRAHAGVNPEAGLGAKSAGDESSGSETARDESRGSESARHECRGSEEPRDGATA